MADAISSKEYDITTNQKEKLRNDDTKRDIIEMNRTINPTHYKKYSVFAVIFAVILGIAFNYKSTKENTKDIVKPKVWVLTNSDYHLKHLYLVLERFGYERTTNNTPWDLLWAFPYPFTILKPHLYSLKPHQKVNHYPGLGFITSKVDFATTESKYIPKAFRLPKDKDKFIEYAETHTKSVFVEKDNSHRGVVLKNVMDIDAKGGKFVQEYLQSPFLVDGYKFDIGVYVVITSVDPLRVYHYGGDVLFRFCPDKYNPFDPANEDKYVIKSDYRPIWKVPALAQLHTEFGFGMKDAFDIYVRSQGKDPSAMWQEVYKAIGEIFIKKEKHVVESLKSYKSQSNFFEMVRVDLILDEDLNVHLLEANLSPNLSSPKPTNQLLYEQVLNSLFSIVGLGSPRRDYETNLSQADCGTAATNTYYASCMKKKAAAAMLSSDKNIAVWGDECINKCLEICEGICALCRKCLSPSDHVTLLEAYREHVNRADFRRLLPPTMTPNASLKHLEHLTPKNRLMYMWYQGKCNVDIAWCT